MELPPSTSYPKFLQYVDAISDWDVRCKEDGIHDYAVELRMIKDSYEIECIKEATRITDLIINEIEEKFTQEL